MSSPLFFPDKDSPRSRRRRNPVDLDSRVDQLVSAAFQTPPLSRSMQRFLNSYPHFSRLISRHVRVLSQRQYDFAEGEMTVFDKALLAITRDGADVQSVAAILFYCEMWCEYNPSAGSPTESMHDMAQIATLPWDRNCDRSERRPETAPDPPSSVSSFDQHRPRIEDGLKRLLGEYERAVRDFQAVENLKNHQTEAAARFLRDTAENAMLLLQNTNVDQRKLSEIEQTYEITKQFVQDMSGKIRKFDPGWHPRAPQREKTGRSARGREHRQRRDYDARNFNEVHIKIEDDDILQSGRSLGANASPQDVCQSLPARDTDANGYRVEETTRRRRSRSPSRDEYTVSRQRGAGGYNPGIRIRGNGSIDPPTTSNGRGHSGIPYGYAEYRVVDTYRPGR